MAAPGAKSVSVGRMGKAHVPGVGGKVAPTNWLAPMNPKQLRTQAVKTITATYRPDQKELNSQQARQSAIYNKQVRDNQDFEKWYQGQAAQITAQNNAANQAIMTQMGQATADANAAYAPQAADLTAGADARQGNVSNNAMAAPFGQQLTDSQNVDRGIVGSSEQAALKGLGTGTSVLAATNANNVGRVQEGQQKELATYQTQLGNIATERTKLRSTQAGDIQKEIARLQGIEVQKAQSQENVSLAAKKLGISNAQFLATLGLNNRKVDLAAKTLAEKTANDAAVNALRAKAIAAGLTEAQWRTMLGTKTYDLNVQKFGAAQATDRYLRNHNLGQYAPKTTGSTSTFGTQAEQNTIVNNIERLKGEFNFITQNMGYSPTQALGMLSRGGSYSYKDSTTGKTVTRSFTSTGKTAELQAAYDLFHGGGLTPVDIAALNKMGLQIGGRLKRAPGQVPPAGAGGY